LTPPRGSGFEPGSGHPAEIAKQFLNPACRGATGISAATRQQLNLIVNTPTSTAGTPTAR
jgi:hypothetical protein